MISYGVGSLTNGVFKCDVRIRNFLEDFEYLKRGHYVEAHGFLKYTCKYCLIVLHNSLSY